MKQLVASFCMLSLIVHLFMGVTTHVHAADCQSQVQHGSQSTKAATPHSHSCGCDHHHHHEDADPIEDNEGEDHDHQLHYHPPHCTCLTPSHAVFACEVTVSSKKLTTAVSQKSNVHRSEGKSYQAAVPSIGPPPLPDIGTHLRGNYASVVFCVFVA